MSLTRAQRQQRNDQIVRAYTGGDNEHQVAERFGLSVAAIEKILDDKQVGVRRGRNYRPHRKTYEAGASIRTLAREVGVSYGTMHNGLSDAGTNFRDRGGRTPPGPAATARPRREESRAHVRAESPRRSARTPDTTPTSARRIQPASPSHRNLGERR